MNSIETRTYEMFLRVQEFGANPPAQVSANAYAGELFTNLRQIVKQLDTQTAAKSTGARAVKESVAGKEVARTKLHAKLEAISRTARAMAAATPGAADKFSVPNRLKDQELLSLARAFAVDAPPFKPEFVKRGLPASFIEDLSEAVEQFEQTVDRKIQSTETRVISTAAVKELMRAGVAVVRELNPMMLNILADDAAALTAWEGASRVERAARRAKANVQPAPSADATA